MNKGRKAWAIGALTVLAISAVVFTVDLGPRMEYVPEPAFVQAVDTIPDPPGAYGIPMSGFLIEQEHVRKGSTFGDLLSAHGIGYPVVDSLVRLAEGVFDVKRMQVGRPIAFVFTDDEAHELRYFVYEVDLVEHVVFSTQAPLGVRVGRREIDTQVAQVSVPVTGALYNDLDQAGADPMLSMLLAEIYAWTVDFYRIQKGDRFTLIFEEQRVDGQRYGRPKILAARYESGDAVRDAYFFEQDDQADYFDPEGNSLRKAFLQAPLKFSRISSGFSRRRFHPVQKRFKAHLGTDYAAPYGTPILAVGDGVVEKAGYTGGNGKYVKIRHNGTYSTQYLHMRKILVNQGQRVAQGDVIGEVGSTGLATGPHVCFRFWKNGSQVDHRREEFPSAEPVATAHRARFVREASRLMAELDEARHRADQRVVF
ncbi:MAG: peptidoglycan DD-metalloendopeptidase family protein [Flavobacteriales bacterium]|nr:peptidoglycan DD-metalloendopeptidase family protein [Flavobacteriales bacterium]